MPGWNFAEVWEAVAEQSPTRRPRSRATGVSPGSSSTSGPTASPTRCSRPAWRAGQGRPVPLQLPRVPRVDVRHLEGRAAPRSTRTTATPTTSSSTSGTTPTPSPWSSTARSTERIERIRDRVAARPTWLWVDDGTGACPDWAVPYEEAAASHPGRVIPPWGRGGDHLYMLYTGGTTGMPKGVMWRQDDLFRNLAGARSTPRTARTRRPRLRPRARCTAPGIVGLPACPLMHGTGCMTQLIVLLAAAARVVTLESAQPRHRGDARHHRAREAST